jgi:glutamyl-tRNA reductase
VSLVVVGLNHRTASVDLLERMTVAGPGLPKALHALVEREHLAEAVMLSTCNRTEVYARATLFHPGVDDARHFLAELAGIDPDLLAESLYTYHEDAAVTHLFAVAAGLDSMIVGEGEILGQVREAWQAAEREGTTGPALSRAFRKAVEVGKRARTETAIGRQGASIASAAVALAAERLGTLDGRKALLLGAGEAGEQMALALAGAGIREIVIANRGQARAEALAGRVGGRAISLAELPDHLVGSDVLLSSTGAAGVLIERADIEDVMTRRDGRALLVVDVAVPRDIDPGVGQVFGVTLLDIEALRDFGEHSLAQHRVDVGRVREIITDELERFRGESLAREVAPLVTALRSRAEAIRRAEIDRAGSKGLSAEARAVLEQVTERLVNKLLHEPTVRVKDAAGSDRGDVLADALADLFALDDPE